MADRLLERWRSSVPGEAANAFLCDPRSGSVFVGDGWSVAYAALRLHRLDPRTGAHLGEIRTRHQVVSSMAVYANHLYAATDSRLFELHVADLSVVRQWERGLVRYTMRIVPAGSSLAVANWWMPSIGLFDPASGRTRRLKVGLQPLLVPYRGATKVLAGFDGGMWTLDAERGRLTEATPTPPVTAVAAGAHVWAVLAGRAEGVRGEPPAQVKRGSDRLIRLTGEPWTAQVGSPCSTVACDDANGVLWCVTNRGGELQAVSQTSGKVVASFAAGPGHSFAHVDPAAGLAFTMEPHRITEANRIVSCTSTLVCHSLA